MAEPEILIKVAMELFDCEKEKEKCTACINEWRPLCSRRNCDFSSGDGEYDNQRQSGSLWCCVCWCMSCCLLCPHALWSTFVACLYVMYRSFCSCFIVLLCGVCYLCANQCNCHASCCCSQCQTSGTQAGDEKRTCHPTTAAEDVV